MKFSSADLRKIIQEEVRATDFIAAQNKVQEFYNWIKEFNLDDAIKVDQQAIADVEASLLTLYRELRKLS